MCKLIVNADDFGLSKGVNYGIIDGFQNGIITSTTMMMNMDFIEHGIALYKENHSLGLGIHLTLSAGKPLNSNLKTIVDESGNFYDKSAIGNVKMNMEEVYNEFKCQIEKFIELVHEKPSHIDSHHHVHLIDGIKDEVLKLAKEYDVPVRGLETDYENVFFTSDFYSSNANNDFFETYKEIFMKTKIVEMMTHPAYLDDTLLKKSSYNVKRVEELSILKSDSLKNFIIENNIKLINFRNLRKIKED